MNTEADHLIHGYFDETLTHEQLRELNAWIKDSPDGAHRFATLALLNDRLHDCFRSVSVWNADLPELGVVRPEILPVRGRWKRRVFLSAAAVAAVAAGLLVLQATSSRRTQAAETELVRMIEVSRQAVDRTYRIVSLNKPQPPGPPPGQDPQRARPPIDGALLYTRGQDQHVLMRQYANGDTFLTGSNGRESWAIPPQGPVQVSSDPTRYRGAAPGEKQNVPFLIPEALDRLRTNYQLRIEPSEPGHVELSRLIAVRQSTDGRGPRRVTLWFHAGRDVIERMRFEGLPSAQGNPLNIELELIDQRDLGPDFFNHSAHHTSDRPVNQES